MGSLVVVCAGGGGGGGVEGDNERKEVTFSV